MHSSISQSSQEHSISQSSQVHSISQSSQLHVSTSQSFQAHSTSQSSQVHTAWQSSQVHPVSQPSHWHISNDGISESWEPNTEVSWTSQVLSWLGSCPGVIRVLSSTGCSTGSFNSTKSSSSLNVAGLVQ